jgi:type IV pilus assembly protein PilB
MIPNYEIQIGEALVREEIITKVQLEHALQVQRDSIRKKRLGEILVDLGYTTKRELREVGRKYKFKSPLGEILRESGAISEDGLKKALESQKARNKPLGQILVEEKLITEEGLSRALSEQLDIPYILPDKRLVDLRLYNRLSEKFMTEYFVLPLWENEGIITVVVADPLDTFVQNFIKNAVGLKYDLAVAPRSSIARVIQEIAREKALVNTTPTVVDEERVDAFRRYSLDSVQLARGTAGQVVNIVDYILAGAMSDRASDIHIESQADKIRVRYRVDGVLLHKTDIPKHLSDSIFRRLRVLARINVTDVKEPHEGRVFAKCNNQDVDLRVAIYPTVLGESATIRILTKEIGLRDLEDLGMLSRVLEILKRVVDSPSGFVIFSGPTGVGKTTTLYACLNYLNRANLKIVTLEDPVEYSIEGIAQMQITAPNEDLVEKVVKAMMHQDPDVMVFGEVNNEATARGAVHAALTGHRVLSTIHTDDSIAAIMRLMDYGLRTYLVSSTSLAVLSQRLVSKICPFCKEEYTPSAELLREFRLRDFDPDTVEFQHGAGCAECNMTGFFARTGIFELLVFNDEIRRYFLDSMNATEIRTHAFKTGNYISLREAGFIKALQGVTTLEQVVSMLSYSEKESFAGVDLSFNEVKKWAGM